MFLLQQSPLLKKKIYKLKLLKVNIRVEVKVIKKDIMIMIEKIGEDTEFKKRLKKLKNLRRSLIQNIKKEDSLILM